MQSNLWKKLIFYHFHHLLFARLQVTFKKTIPFVVLKEFHNSSEQKNLTFLHLRYHQFSGRLFLPTGHIQKRRTSFNSSRVANFLLPRSFAVGTWTTTTTVSAKFRVLTSHFPPFVTYHSRKVEGRSILLGAIRASEMLARWSKAAAGPPESVSGGIIFR